MGEFLSTSCSLLVKARVIWINCNAPPWQPFKNQLALVHALVLFKWNPDLKERALLGPVPAWTRPSCSFTRSLTITSPKPVPAVVSAGRA